MRHALDKAITYAVAMIIVATVLLPWVWGELRAYCAHEARWQETTV